MDTTTIHVVATTVEGTRAALEEATAMARGDSGRVVLFLRRSAPTLDKGPASDRGAAERALRQLTESFNPRPNILACVCQRAVDIVQLFQSSARVVIGGN